MEIEFLDRFTKELDKIKVKSVKTSVVKLIQKVELANNLHDIPNIKKLEGHKSAYRIRLGDYRVGIFVEGNRIEFARIIHRKDIYKSFP